MSNFMAVPDGTDLAGLIVWWELSGFIDYDDLRDTWTAAGLADLYLPTPVTPAAALQRAAGDALSHRRQLCRPLRKRGTWEVVFESVDEVAGSESIFLTYEHMVIGGIDGNKMPYVRVQPPYSQTKATL